MIPPQFLSPDPAARIEPADFVAHFLAQRGLDSVGLRQTVVLPLIPALEHRLVRLLGAPAPQPYPLPHQRLYHPVGQPFSVMTSPMGAPMAVLLLEQLIALGGRRFIYLGFCGALAPSYHIGDLFLPTVAVREEGTSYHYLPAEAVPCAAPRVQAALQAQAQRRHLTLRQGPIWTTDALYRETPHKIRHWQAAGVHAVDMEMAALFAVAQYRECEVGALLVVSDECYHTVWQPGFGSARLRQACEEAAAVAVAAAAHLALLRP